MRKFWKTLLHFPWGYLLFFLLFGAGGVLYLLFPSASVSWTGRILGGLTVVMFAFSGVRLVGQKKRGGVFFLKMLGCLLAVLMGGYMLLFPDQSLPYLSLAVGVYALMDAGAKLMLSGQANRHHLLLWWALTVTSLLAAAGGVFLLRFPYVPYEENIVPNAVLMGITMLLCGVGNFLSAFAFHGVRLREQKEQEDGATTVVIDAEGARRQAREANGTEESDLFTMK